MHNRFAIAPPSVKSRSELVFGLALPTLSWTEIGQEIVAPPIQTSSPLRPCHGSLRCSACADPTVPPPPAFSVGSIPQLRDYYSRRTLRCSAESDVGCGLGLSPEISRKTYQVVQSAGSLHRIWGTGCPPLSKQTSFGGCSSKNLPLCLQGLAPPLVPAALGDSDQTVVDTSFGGVLGDLV